MFEACIFCQYSSTLCPQDGTQDPRSCDTHYKRTFFTYAPQLLLPVSPPVGIHSNVAAGWLYSFDATIWRCFEYLIVHLITYFY